MKKAITAILALALAVSFGGCSGKDKNYVIGICQQMQHDALDAATEGFKTALIEEFGDKVTFDYQNASGDSTNCSTIINSFVSKNVDLIMANATSALQAAAAGTTSIPILGTSVTNYGKALEISDYTGTVGGNISGTSDLAPLDQQEQMIVDILPNAKTVGLLYCSSEPNSQYQVDIVKQELEAKGITCNTYAFSDSNDIAAICSKACADCDAIYIPTDNTAANSTGVIDSICRPAGIPIIAGEEGICKGCGVTTLSISYYDLGYQTGQMAIKVLKGEANISEMPIEFSSKFTKKYNAAICEELNITIPDDYIAIEN